MKKLGRALVLIGSSCTLLLGSATAVVASASPTEIDLSGPTATDQTPPTSSLVVDTVTAPTATSVNGDSTASLTTSVLSPYYVDSPADLQVYTSTESGTSAVTGVVTGNSGVISGATVILQPSAGGSATTVTSDSNGGFAFVNMPVGSSGTAYTISVSAPGYGSYAVTNDMYLPDLTYEMTVSLTTSAQSYDASQTVSQGTQSTADTGALAPYTSFHRPPPTIKVAMYAQGANCTPSGSFTIKQYPFEYYALHVTASEIFHNWPETVVRANMVAITNYAWHFVRHPPNSSYNVDDTTNFQCFETFQKIPSSWPGWMDGMFGSALQQSGDIEITQFRAGNNECSDPSFPANGNILSQLGSLALNRNCGYSFYKNIDNYYYTGSFANNTSPPVPNTSFSRPANAVKLTFPSQVSDSNGHTSNIGWVYTVDEFDTNLPTAHWITIYHKGWEWSSRSIPTSFTRSTGSCFAYRAKATNPVGGSQYASFNNGNVICPG